MSAGARIAEETARAQGLPAKVADAGALAKIAVLVDVEPPPASGPARSTRKKVAA